MSDSTYASYSDWKGWSRLKFGELDRGAELYFAAEMSLAGFHSLSGCALLELGFGNGGFARWAHHRGAAYKGIERLPELVMAGRANGYLVYSDDTDLADVADDDSLDGVVALDVFEHMTVDELRRVLARVARCVKPGGLILGRVPSGDSPFARAIQYGDVTHKCVLGGSAIRQLANFCELEVRQIRSPAFPIFGLGAATAVKRVAVGLSRAIAFPLLQAVFMGNAGAILTPNLVFVLRKPS